MTGRTVGSVGGLGEAVTAAVRCRPLENRRHRHGQLWRSHPACKPLQGEGCSETRLHMLPPSLRRRRHNCCPIWWHHCHCWCPSLQSPAHPPSPLNCVISSVLCDNYNSMSTTILAAAIKGSEVRVRASESELVVMGQEGSAVARALDSELHFRALSTPACTGGPSIRPSSAHGWYQWRRRRRPPTPHPHLFGC